METEQGIRGGWEWYVDDVIGRMTDWEKEVARKRDVRTVEDYVEGLLAGCKMGQSKRQDVENRQPAWVSFHFVL